MDDKQNTSTDIIGEMCNGPIPQHDWEVLHRYEYLFKEPFKYNSSAIAVGNAMKLR